MTLDEAIKHAEEVADEKEKESKVYAKLRTYEDLTLFEHEETSCKSCAEEHRQLAEWLKELKMYREMIPSASEVFIANIRKESD